MDVDSFFASDVGASMSTEPARSSNTTAGAQPEPKKRKRQQYTADQTRVLQNALQAGELQTTQQRKEIAALLTGMMGRDVTAQDVSTWVQNKKKKADK
jgi:hypothetical protein